MQKLIAFGLAAALAVAGLGLTSGSAEAHYKHRHFNGFSFGIHKGKPYFFGGYRRHRAYPRYYAPRRAYRGRRGPHVSWCYNRYRSYRAHDNTFQPYHGPRRACRSPYFRYR